MAMHLEKLADMKGWRTQPPKLFRVVHQLTGGSVPEYHWKPLLFGETPGKPPAVEISEIALTAETLPDGVFRALWPASPICLAHVLVMETWAHPDPDATKHYSKWRWGTFGEVEGSLEARVALVGVRNRQFAWQRIRGDKPTWRTLHDARGEIGGGLQSIRSLARLQKVVDRRS